LESKEQWIALTETRTELAKEIRRAQTLKGIDWSPRAEKALVLRTDGRANALTTLEHDKNKLLVLVSVRSTPTPSASTANTSRGIPTMETQQLSMFQPSPTSTCSLVVFRVKLSALLEKEEGLMTCEVHSFLKSHGFCEKRSRGVFYSKTLRVYFLTTRELLSRQSLGFSPTWGIEIYSGRYLTASTSGFPRTGSACSLQDILDSEVDGKYFLSEKAMAGLIKRDRDRPDLGYSATRSIAVITREPTGSDS